jgi:hypothetical protein
MIVPAPLFSSLHLPPNRRPVRDGKSGLTRHGEILMHAQQEKQPRNCSNEDLDLGSSPVSQANDRCLRAEVR